MSASALPASSRGFSLLELMVTIAVLAIVSMIALPSFQEMIRSNRVTTQTNELMASLALARTEAIRTNTSVVGNRDVVLCPSANGTTCAANWNQGWIVARRIDDTVSTVLRHTQAPSGVVVAAAAAEVVFDNRGRRVVGPAALTVRAAVCPSGQPYLRTLTINGSGQVRITAGNCP